MLVFLDAALDAFSEMQYLNIRMFLKRECPQGNTILQCFEIGYRTMSEEHINLLTS